MWQVLWVGTRGICHRLRRAKSASRGLSEQRLGAVSSAELHRASKSRFPVKDSTVAVGTEFEFAVMEASQGDFG